MTLQQYLSILPCLPLRSFSRFLLIKVQLSQALRKVDKMNVRISLTLEASEIFLSLHMIFSLERAAVAWTILERISGFEPSLEMIVPMFLKFSASSSL